MLKFIAKKIKTGKEIKIWGKERGKEREREEGKEEKKEVRNRQVSYSVIWGEESLLRAQHQCRP